MNLKEQQKHGINQQNLFFRNNQIIALPTYSKSLEKKDNNPEKKKFSKHSFLERGIISQSFKVVR